MTELIQVFASTILPIFLVIGLVAVVGKIHKPDPRPVSTLLIYLFSPALVLHGLANSDLKGDELGQIILMVAGVTFGVWLVGWLIARGLRFDPKTTSAFLLVAVFINSGNYGIPLNRFAFGEAGAERALVYYAVSAVMANTIGVYIASSGAGSTRQAFLNVFKVPLPYAAVLGIFLNLSGIDILKAGGALEPAGKAVELLGQAAVPAMLTLLGLQLIRTSVKGRLVPIFLAAGTRLVIASLIAFALAAFLGLEGLTRQVSIVESSMSTAVMSIALATEFGSDTEFVSAGILVSTLASIVTLSILLTII
ncbi:MAG: AEC family transporter [Anaerolineae bacterium]|nr:AEC family transporter [Anaerolineae bacterium]